MAAVRSMWRLLGIGAVLTRYRLDELVDAVHLFRPLKWLRAVLPRPRADIERLTRGARLRLALEELGPIFVKFGQILSTRRDLMPTDVAIELALLQDRVAPFPGVLAQQQIEAALGAPIATLFQSFDIEPLASASIAQVHAARLADGREVVVKVLRPGVAGRIEADVALLRAFARLAARFLPNADKIRPLEVVAEIERTLCDELDLMREGASASLLRRNFLGSDDLYVPEVIWSHSKDGALTMERVRGIPADDIAALDAAGIDRARLAEKGVRVFYTQVFRDNFFHADAHAGNVWVDAERKEDPRYIVLDFGIMGALPRDDLRYLAENFTAMFDLDYRRIAELHVEAGWMPEHIRIEELEAAVRTVCEPYFTRPLSEISLGEVLVKLFSVARRYELTIQPQLILLQKTLLNIEGLGRLLHPKLDIWATAKPVLADILKTRYSFAMAAKEMRSRLPDWLAQAPEIPRLVHDYLDRANRGTLEYRFASADLKRLADESRSGQRRTVFAVLGCGLLVAGAVIYSLGPAGPQFFGQSMLALLLGFGSVLAFAAAWPRE